MKKFLALALAAVAGSSALAASWTEVGDAGRLPETAQSTDGSGALEFIDGALSRTQEDFVDMYCIRITSVEAFIATSDTPTTGSMDTQLWLFDSTGHGVTFNDDVPGGGSGNFRSRITGQFVPGPGVYLLAISLYDQDARSGGSDMWLDSPFATERQPDGAGAAGVVDSWAGSVGSGNPGGAYKIALNGAAFCTPEPASALLLALGALAFRRR